MRPFTLLILLLPKRSVLPVAKAANQATVLTVVIGAMPLARSTRRS